VHGIGLIFTVLARDVIQLGTKQFNNQRKGDLQKEMQLCKH